jgi:hypothetical protein
MRPEEILNLRDINSIRGISRNANVLSFKPSWGRASCLHTIVIKLLSSVEECDYNICFYYLSPVQNGAQKSAMTQHLFSLPFYVSPTYIISSKQDTHIMTNYLLTLQYLLY